MAIANQRRYLIFLCLFPVAFIIIFIFTVYRLGSTFRIFPESSFAPTVTEPTTVTTIEPATIHYDPSPLEETIGPFTSAEDDIERNVFQFTPPDVKPAWLTKERTGGPLVLRMGIISAPGEFDRRKALREYVLHDLHPTEVVIDHRFFVGWSDPATMANSSEYDRLVMEEELHHRDIYRMDVIDSKDRLGEKRWKMLQWAREAHFSTYDYYLAADSDAFFRMVALSRRIPYLLSLTPEEEDDATRTVLGNRSYTNPRTESIMMGLMSRHNVHFRPNPYDNSSTYQTEDHVLTPEEVAASPKIKVVEYPYPIGFAMLLSSHLVDKLTAPGVMLPHHVHYPSDDVMVGQWVSEEVPETRIINDRRGFHDALGHNEWMDKTAVVTWDTVCPHHLSPKEMRGVRRMPEYQDEWVDDS